MGRGKDYGKRAGPAPVPHSEHGALGERCCFHQQSLGGWNTALTHGPAELTTVTSTLDGQGDPSREPAPGTSQALCHSAQGLSLTARCLVLFSSLLASMTYSVSLFLLSYSKLEEKVSTRLKGPRRNSLGGGQNGIQGTEDV